MVTHLLKSFGSFHRSPSLLPVFKGKQRPGHEVLCWSLPGHHAIRMGHWKAVKPKTNSEWQLFDLDADGTETTDLAKQEPDRVQALAAQFEKWRERVGAN